MTLPRRTIPMAILLALASPRAVAEIPLGTLAGSEVGFEGMLQSDANWFHSDVADLNGDAHDGDDADFELRRAELVLKGKGPGRLEWVIGYDAKAEKWLDTHLKFNLEGNQSLLLGQSKQPNSLEELSSSKSNDFISKAAITNTWAVGRRLGATYAYGSGNWGIQASAFSRELTRGNAEGDGFAVRGTLAPINEKGRVLHLGLSHARYAARLAGSDAQRWRARPQADLAGVRLVDTGTLANADTVQTIGVEALWMQGPFKLQGEYMRSSTTRGGGFDDFSGSGAYLSALWNVTGERWGYKAGTPATPKPDRPATGMLQLGLRYDMLDLDDGSVDRSGAIPVVVGVLGGRMDAWTVGANYYWQSNFKLALNYVKARTSRYSATTGTDVDDDPGIVELRAQLFW